MNNDERVRNKATGKRNVGTYCSVLKLSFTLRALASAEAPESPILFPSRLWKRVLQN